MISFTTPSLNIKLTIAVSIIALLLKISSKPIMYSINLKFSLMTNERVFQLYLLRCKENKLISCPLYVF